MPLQFYKWERLRSEYWESFGTERVEGKVKNAVCCLLLACWTHRAPFCGAFLPFSVFPWAYLGPCSLHFQLSRPCRQWYFPSIGFLYPFFFSYLSKCSDIFLFCFVFLAIFNSFASTSYSRVGLDNELWNPALKSSSIFIFSSLNSASSYGDE